MIEKIQLIWNASYGELFPIDERLIRRNLLECEAPVDWVQADGCLALLRRPKPLWPELDQNTCWIAAFAGDAAALAAVIDQARAQGYKKLSFGADPFHLWPGVPKEYSELIRLLEDHGFEMGGEAFDLSADLGQIALPSVDLPSGYRIAMLDEPSQLLDFLSTEFPGRWHYDTANRLKQETYGLVLLWRGDRVVGFSHIFDETSADLGGSVFWRAAMGRHWGGLGPIGIGKSERGKGLGMALLIGALRVLQSHGARQCVIDWTDLANFYGKLGFKPWRTYLRAWKAL